MSYAEDKQNEELADLYPEGSREREVLEYSRGSHAHGEVPEALVGAFKVLMGISILMGVVSLVVSFSQV